MSLWIISGYFHCVSIKSYIAPNGQNLLKWADLSPPYLEVMAVFVPYDFAIIRIRLL